MKYVSIDLETTGINPKNSSILEFGAVIDDLSNPLPLKKLPRFHGYIKEPNDVITGEYYALQMNQAIIKKIAKGKIDNKNIYTPYSILYHFYLFLQKHGYTTTKESKISIIPAGKNFDSFDRRFIEKLKDYKFYFNIAHRSIDPGPMYLEKDDDKVPDLKTCLKRAGINKKVAHNAIDDALDVVKLIRYKLL